MSRGRAVWITWSRHRRTEELAGRLKIPLIVFQANLPRAVKHPYFLIRTLILLVRVRPEILFVQNPSMILTILTVALKRVLRYKLVVDAHNIGIYFYPDRRKYRWLYRYCHKGADLTIVTNALLAEIVEQNFGNAFILQDPLPRVAQLATRNRCMFGDSDEKRVVFICSFSPDEPVEEVIESAQYLGEEVRLYITGNYKRYRGRKKHANSPRVVFTGFLDDMCYIRLLSGADVIIDLTDMEDCLVCGAYEAVSLGVPLVLSDTPANRSYFTKGVIYTNHRAESIAEAIQLALKNRKHLRDEMGALREELASHWEERFNRLMAVISQLQEGR